MRRLRVFRLGLRRRVVVVIVASYIVLAVFFVLPSIAIYHYLVEREMVGSAIVLARYIASTSQSLLQEGATDTLRTLTRDLVATGGDEIRYVEVVGPGEQVVAPPGAQEPLSLAPPLWRRADGKYGQIVRELGEVDWLWVHLFGHTFDIAVPLGRAEAPTGWIRLGVSTAQANRKMREVTLVNLGIALAAIVASVLVAWLVDRRIRASLSDLMEVTRQMARGDLSLRAEIRTGDELQGLGDSFNLMADQLARHQAGLEERVAARTRELAETSDTLRRIQTEQIRYERLSVLGEMTAVVSHEIRTPLNALSIHVQRLKRKLRGVQSSETRQITEMLDLIAFEITRIQNVINEYMRFARPRLGQALRVDVNAIVKSVLHLLDLEARRVGVQVEFRPGQDVPPVWMEEDKLREVFLNLLMNSLQAVPRGGRVVVETARANGGALLARVSDTGPGIPAEDLDKVFQPFFTTKPGGTGLGLAIVARIVKEVGGEVQCVSQAGRGTEFEIILPAASRDNTSGALDKEGQA